MKKNLKVVVLLFLTFFSISLSECLAKEPSRPVLFIPGIFGSKLADANGKIIWGGASSYANFRKLELPQNEAAIKYHPAGIIKAIPIVWPFKIKQYEGLVENLLNAGYKKDKNFFVFPYDWRKSNFKTAALLNDFIKKTPALKAGKFDIVAHSMGGLVALILIHDHESGRRVENLVTLGTPFLGSLNAFDTFQNGFEGVSGFMSEIGTTLDQVRAVLFSFESGYELLPHYANCCVLGPRHDPKRKPVSIFDLGFWMKEWLPPNRSTKSDKEFLKKSLSNAKKLRTLVRQPLPATLNRLFKYAGDKFPTKTQVWLKKNGKVHSYEEKGGDGTVWLTSAALNRVQDARVSFSKHARIFDDDSVKVGLQRILVPDGPLQNYAATLKDVEFRSTKGVNIPVDLVSFEAMPPIVKLGQSVKITLGLNGLAISQSPEQFSFSVCLISSKPGAQENCMAMNEITAAGLKRIFTIVYTPTSAGEYTIRIDQDDSLEDYFAVVS